MTAPTMSVEDLVNSAFDAPTCEWEWWLTRPPCGPQPATHLAVMGKRCGAGKPVEERDRFVCDRCCADIRLFQTARCPGCGGRGVAWHFVVEVKPL